MSEPFDEYKDLGQRNHSLIIHQMGLIGQNNLAAYLKVSDSTISGWKEKEFLVYSRAMAFLSIKLRNVSDRCFTEEQIQRYDVLSEFGREYLHKYPRMGDIK